MKTAGAATAPFARARLGILLASLLALVVAIALIGTDGLRDFLTTVGDSRWGFVAFVVAYAAAVVLLLPGTLGTMTAGAVFGFSVGGFAALAGATLGATAAFVIARVMGRDGVQDLLGTRLDEVDQFVERNDFSSILLLRLMPIVPFNLLNYASGLSAARLSRYVAASFVGMAPGTFLTTAVADQADDPTSGTFIVLLGLFVIALVGSIFVGKRLRSDSTSDV